MIASRTNVVPDVYLCRIAASTVIGVGPYVRDYLSQSSIPSFDTVKYNNGLKSC